MTRPHSNSQPPLSSHRSQPLRPFAEGEASRRLKLTFTVERHKDRLDFCFILAGGRPADLHQLVIPEPQEASQRRRRDELWKSTCLEIFVGPSDQNTYLELNLSPSGDWNVYAFDAYRAGMKPAVNVSEPLMSFVKGSDELVWQASLRLKDEGSDLGEVRGLLASRSLVLGATAVLEYGTGEREYWALVHAGTKPDFHLRESFRLAL